MLRTLTVVFGAALVLGAAAQVPAEDKVDLKVGDAAPKFEAKDDTGKVVKSADVVGKKIIVVYFYPADLTGGCTKQACGFRDDMKALGDKDVLVLGVSGDSSENHAIFKKVHGLNFPLLADEKGEVAKAFGVPFTAGEKTFVYKHEGKDITLVRGGTAARWTFLIGKDGKIVMKNTEVKAADDSKAIIKAVSDLK